MGKILITRIYENVFKIGINISKIKNQLKFMGQEIEDLKTKVAENGTVIGSAIVLITEIKTRLDEAIATDDTAALTQLSNDLGSQGQSLANAIVANTPVV